ncbi:hypothetical protein DRO59_00230 [Candidatus Bathyarchaeota archaeon]|mgnify:CR=1 FL=1|nr:MAG: hypothetical protein DRO59_00230 [Candidatus Bathyarchaeota archaeon]
MFKKHGKKTLILALALMSCVGIASAALLEYYGKIITTVNVKPSILLDGEDYKTPITEELTDVCGIVFSQPHYLENLANIPAKMEFTYEVINETGQPDDRGITVTYWKLDEPEEPVPSETNEVTPSTNEQNIANNWAHVIVSYDGVNAGEVKLTFVQPRDFYACFEYRTDGDTSQMISPDNYNTEITDGLYPYVCLYPPETGHNVTMILSADEYVEVRMVFGGETDERFNWTRIDVLGTKIPEATPFTLEPGERLDFCICYRFETRVVGNYTITTEVVPA